MRLHALGRQSNTDAKSNAVEVRAGVLRIETAGAHAPAIPCYDSGCTQDPTALTDAIFPRPSTMD